MGVAFKAFVCKWTKWIGPDAAAKVHGHACSMCQRKMSKPICCSRLRVFNPSVTVQALSEYSTGCGIKSGQRHFTSTVTDVFTLMIPQEILKHYLEHWAVYFPENSIVICFGQVMPYPQSELGTLAFTHYPRQICDIRIIAFEEPKVLCRCPNVWVCSWIAGFVFLKSFAFSFLFTSGHAGMKSVWTGPFISMCCNRSTHVSFDFPASDCKLCTDTCGRITSNATKCLHQKVETIELYSNT